MTEDTRRALEIIKPIADELGITVSADENWLFCEYHGMLQPIAITFNSTYATLKMFIGYLASYLVYRQGIEWNELETYVKQYWKKERNDEH